MQLNPQDVARAALAAHAENRLCAQNLTGDQHEAINFYRHHTKPGVACAVGAALPDDLANKAAYPISANPTHWITFTTDEAPRQLDKLQELHDTWSTAVMDHRRHPERTHVAASEAAFLAYAKELAQ